MQRTLGWVQNPNVLSTLKNVTSALVKDSYFNLTLRNYKLPLLLKNNLISTENCAEFMALLSHPEMGISYDKLKGKGGARGINTHGVPNSKCTGIVQAAIDAQKDIEVTDLLDCKVSIKKPYSDDWTADGYVRWACSVGLLDYNARTDRVTATARGKALVLSKDGSEDEYKLFTAALLSYPPAVRVLRILSDGEKYTKYEIGAQLGFKGELGFTSIPQNLFVAEIGSAKTSAERAKIRSNEEGDADKYARTIARWLEQMGWLETCSKKVNETYLGKSYTMSLHAYQITPKGMKALKQSGGYSSRAKIPKIVYFEMLASKAPDVNFLRTKRAYIIRCLSSRSPKTYESIQAYLKTFKIDVSLETIRDDIIGLGRIGLNFTMAAETVQLLDSVTNLEIPQVKFESLEISEMKEQIRSKLHHIDHKYLILVDLAYSDASTVSRKNADAKEFEIETASLFTEELGFEGLRLGDASKPDVIISYSKNGAILDNKSYKNGFSVDAHNADEMSRYILQNKNRRPGEPSNEWWKAFSSDVTDFRFLFITSFLKGNFVNNLKSIHANTGVSGGAVGINNLLYIAEDIKSGKMQKEQFFAMMNDCELLA